MPCIEADIKSNDIVLYMKGSKKLPQCGFSATVAAVMERLGISDYKDINVLADPEIREGEKPMRSGPPFHNSTSRVNLSAAATSCAICTNPASCNRC